MKHIYNILTLTVGAILTLTACSDDLFSWTSDEQASDYIGFTAGLEGTLRPSSRVTAGRLAIETEDWQMQDLFCNKTQNNDHAATSNSVSSSETSSLGTSSRVGSSLGASSLGASSAYGSTSANTDPFMEFPEYVAAYYGGRASNNTPTSRGAIATSLEDDITNAAVYGFSMEGTWTTDATPHIINCKKYTFSNGQMIPADDTQKTKWKELSDENMRFYIFAPYSVCEGDNAPMKGLPSEDTKAVDTQLTYTVPAAAANQPDLVYAVSDDTYDKDYQKLVPLQFHHGLTAIQFKMGFKAYVTYIEISNIYGKGIFDAGTGGWKTTYTGNSPDASYTYSIDSEIGANSMLNDGNNIFMLMPQEFLYAADYAESGVAEPKITLHYKDSQSDTETKTITASLAGTGKWESGKKILYTLYKNQAPEYIYFDLALGGVSITANSYSGTIWDQTANDGSGANKTISATNLTTDQMKALRFYIYQSTDSNKSSTGLQYVTDSEGNSIKTKDGSADSTTVVVPAYPSVTYNGTAWADYVTNNTSVADVYNNWEQATGVKDVRSKTSTNNKIVISGSNVNADVVLDNLYAMYIGAIGERNDVAKRMIQMSFYGYSNSTCTFRLKGDNRISQICYESSKSNNNKFILTSYDGDGSTSGTLTCCTYNGNTATVNRWAAAIGATDSHNDAYGIYIKGGTIFAGTSAADNSTGIGGGGNGLGGVFIEGGTVTAVSSGTCAAIGGGIGWSDPGGNAEIEISGGRTYAYNLENNDNTNNNGCYKIPAAAIGGGSSNASAGNSSTTITISGGYVYAQCNGGVAIGGGGSATKSGGAATVNITGGTIIAKSVASTSGKSDALSAGNGIGGGTGGTNSGSNGGSVTLNVSGGIIKTGSIGGGKTNSSTGRAGSATINITDGDVQGQFIMATDPAYATSQSKWSTCNISGGTIHNSNTSDTEYIHTQKNGGAVYINLGKFIMTGGTIEGCTAEQGGAVYLSNGTVDISGEAVINGCTATNSSSTGKGGAIYMEGTNSSVNTVLTISGGTLKANASQTDGGGIYLTNSGGKSAAATVSGGTFDNNVAQKGNGGGLYINGGTYSQSGGTFQYNQASRSDNTGGDGGGVYVSASQNLTIGITNGTFTSNAADQRGAGIAVAMPDGYNVDLTIGTTTGGSSEDVIITGNHAVKSGGGIYLNGSGSKLTLGSGTVKDNTVSALQDNQNVTIEGGGSLTLADNELNQDIDHIKVTFNGNGGTSNNSSTYTQRIVSSTNNALNACTFTRSGYTFANWNTKADGSGTSYSNAATVNFAVNTTLFAIWKMN